MRSERKRSSLWGTWAVLGAAMAWMVVELLRASWNVGRSAGIGAIALDGVIQHKVGELLVALPLIAVAVLSNVWTKERLLALIRRTQLLMWGGGVLNGLAWLSLRDQVDWAWWCVLLLAAGLLGPWLTHGIAARFGARDLPPSQR